MRLSNNDIVVLAGIALVLAMGAKSAQHRGVTRQVPRRPRKVVRR